MVRRIITVAAWSVVLLLAASGCATPTGAPTATHTAPGSPTASPPASAAITIDEPAGGSIVSVPFTLSGTANTFEAALTVDAVDAAGEVLCTRHTLATSGSGTRGTWTATLAFAPQTGDLPVRVRAYESSAKDGSIVNLVERNVTVSPKRPPIVIVTPVCGNVVAPGGVLAITGYGTVFEAALTVELRDASGSVAFSDNLRTEVGGEESNFSKYVTLPIGLTPGFYDLVAFNASAKDGSAENEFPVQILVQP